MDPTTDSRNNEQDAAATAPPALPPWHVLVSVLHGAAHKRAEVRAALRWLAGELTRVADGAEPPPPVIPQPPPQPTTHVPLRLGDSEARVPVYGALDELATTGAAREQQARTTAAGDLTAAGTGGKAGDERPLPNLRTVARRSRLKSECMRWSLVRRRRITEGASFETVIAPTDQDLISRARELPGCFLWMLDPYESQPDDESGEDIAACYENLAEAAELVEDLLGGEGAEAESYLENAYRALAEAQSAVRAALLPVQTRRDTDQEEAFHWLKRRTFEDQIYVTRHMKLDDPADPARWSDLQARLELLRSGFDQLRSGRRERTQLLNKIRYHAQKLARAEEAEALGEWQTLSSSVERLVANGTPPSDRALRDLLLPLLDSLPESLEPGDGFQLVLREVDRYLAAQESSREETREPRLPTDAVRRVADWLRGRVVVLIGGERRVHSQRALERDFELAELRWISTRVHQSTSEFEPQVARPETALVLLAIRWASHSFEAVKSMADQCGKPYVRLPRGYGTNQVAVEILRQASGWMADPDASKSPA
ncbi:MAG: hypothetical protein IPM18_05020 [Phycisphaerales bacterium]|nr:hypothetical protein [Phycisphaerales bacterium]